MEADEKQRNANTLACATWRAKNRAKWREYQRQWRIANRDKMRAATKRYLAKKKQVAQGI